jgi:DNA-directed RNA polymerase delta subunit
MQLYDKGIKNKSLQNYAANAISNNKFKTVNFDDLVSSNHAHMHVDQSRDINCRFLLTF